MVSTPESLRALLTGIVDYAGLFPPAKLEMGPTVRNYAKYLQSDEGWMLGRLIVPVARLAEFEREAESLLPRDEHGEAGAWQISALTAAASDLSQFERDLEAIEAFNLRQSEDGQGMAVIDAIEIKAAAPDEIGDALDRIPDDLFPFFELPIDRDPRGLITALADGDAGAKVRTGGVTADAYPAPDHLARFMAACVGAEVPFKATAGLHHPLRHFSSSVNANEFGFLNVFMAGCLTTIHQLDAATIGKLLNEKAIEAFEFNDDYAAWGNLRVETEQVEAARDSAVVSFGSCSFDEPVQDLRDLKLLP